MRAVLSTVPLTHHLPAGEQTGRVLMRTNYSKTCQPKATGQPFYKGLFLAQRCMQHWSYELEPELHPSAFLKGAHRRSLLSSYLKFSGKQPLCYFT